MKKSVLIVLLVCLAGNASGVFAQQRPSDEDRKARFERFKAEREEFISKAMKLTDDEKKAFWPLCNELQLKKFELNKTLRDEMRKINQARRANQAVAEADYKKAIELSSRVKVQEAQLDQEYASKFLQVISAEKVFLYRQSEQNFGERMIRDRAGRDNQRLSDAVKKRSDRAKAQAAKAKDRAEAVQKRAEKAKWRAEKIKEKAAERERQLYQRGI
ncbi:MAG: hypothetical protein LBH19_00075 [Dysgonamonadaceae bacterium]|jgi:Spy/CpxP family protein refolding chaperone|nr:hypothetical protein [Dysgonamonadaceae bacterium]